MNLLHLLFCIIAAQATSTELPKHCEGPVFNNIHYSREVLKTGIYYPRSLSYDHSINTLFFSYCPDVENYTVRSAKINLKTNEFADIDGVRNGFAQTVDAITNDVFIGGSDGVYKYDKLSNKAEYYGANGTVVWKIFAKDEVYFSAFPTQFLYKIVSGVAYRYRDLEETLAKNFVIDDFEYLYFTNNSGLFRQAKGTKDAVYFEGTNNTYVSGLSIDKSGDVYASTDDGIHFVSRRSRFLQKIVNVSYAYGVTFDDDDDIIYSDESSIVRLKASSDQDCLRIGLLEL